MKPYIIRRLIVVACVAFLVVVVALATCFIVRLSTPTDGTSDTRWRA